MPNVFFYFIVIKKYSKIFLMQQPSTALLYVVRDLICSWILCGFSVILRQSFLRSLVGRFLYDHCFCLFGCLMVFFRYLMNDNDFFLHQIPHWLTHQILQQILHQILHHQILRQVDHLQLGHYLQQEGHLLHLNHQSSHA
ncbi:hypothetical protein BD560DRAFT_396570 [Blakeslea trispora]|nr:hypothetical protein BD560DRAFT_396570 [Blakeslea trispora]